MKTNKICAVFTLTEEVDTLKPLTNKRPIASLPFASRYRIIDFSLSSAVNAGVQSVALFIGKSGRSVYDHIRGGKPWDLDSAISGGIFTFSQQFYKYSVGSVVGFTADFYEDLTEFVRRSRSKYVYVTGSKILANVALDEVLDHHLSAAAEITSVVSEAGDKMNMYLLSTNLLLDLVDRAVSSELYLEADALVQHYADSYDTSEYVHRGYVANINSAQAYFEANMDMLSYKHFTSLLPIDRLVLTKDRNGAPAFYSEHAAVQNSLVATDCVIRGEVRNSVSFRRVEVAEGASVDHAILMQGCHIEAGARVSYAVLDKGVTVKAGAVLEGTPDQVVVVARNQVIEA